MFWGYNDEKGELFTPIINLILKQWIFANYLH